MTKNNFEISTETWNKSMLSPDEELNIEVKEDYVLIFPKDFSVEESPKFSSEEKVAETSTKEEPEEKKDVKEITSKPGKEKKKLTKRDCIEILMNMEEVKSNIDCMNFLKNELELLNNRKTSPKTESKLKQQESVMNTIRAFLSIDKSKSYTATEILKNAFKGEEISIQKVTAMLKKMVEAKEVKKEVVKKTSYFSIAEAAN